MDIQSLAIYMTDDCNFNCDYCYQSKGNAYSDIRLIDRAIDFFLPYLSKDCTINFYGGEPLLNEDLIQHTTDYIQMKNSTKEHHFVFSMSTNGSLIDEETLTFMDKHEFSLLISFDGTAQDISRKKGSYNDTLKVLQKTLQYPRIELETNSVFTPFTIGSLSESIQMISEMGVPNVSYALSQTSHWDRSSLMRYEQQLESLKDFLFCFHRQNGFIPSVNFRKDPRRGVFTCYAARDRMAIAADGKLWGCHLFADFYKGKEDSEDYAKFCFGDLDSFIENHEEVYPKIAANYDNLRMDQFYTCYSRCAVCPELKDCGVCPMDNMIQGRNFRVIPDWVCEQKRMTLKIKRKFWTELGNPPPTKHPRNYG